MKVVPRKIFNEILVLQDPKLNGKTEDTKIVDEVQPESYGAVTGNNISQLNHQVRSIMASE
jgi:hypothetical protein